MKTAYVSVSRCRSGAPGRIRTHDPLVRRLFPGRKRLILLDPCRAARCDPRSMMSNRVQQQSCKSRALQWVVLQAKPRNYALSRIYILERMAMQPEILWSGKVSGGSLRQAQGRGRLSITPTQKTIHIVAQEDFDSRSMRSKSAAVLNARGGFPSAAQLESPSEECRAGFIQAVVTLSVCRFRSAVISSRGTGPEIR
jgi:hypothetical protein